MGLSTRLLQLCTAIVSYALVSVAHRNLLQSLHGSMSQPLLGAIENVITRQKTCMAIIDFLVALYRMAGLQAQSCIIKSSI